MNRKESLRRAIGMSLALGLFVAPYAVPQSIVPQVFAASVAEAGESVGPEDVVLVGTVQTPLGAAKDWDPSDPKTIMKSDGNGHRVITGLIKKGNYDFKVAVGGSWDLNYGKDGQANGGNIPLRLAADHEVTFTYDEKTHVVSYDYEGKDAEQAKFANQRDIVLCGDLQDTPELDEQVFSLIFRTLQPYMLP